MDKHYVVVGGNSGIAQSALSHLSQESITAYSRQDFDPGITSFQRIPWDVNEPFPGLPPGLEQVDGFLYAPGTITLN
jgi:hypothetical protein